ncbi:hypothetical protein LguiB_011938 [Lonicera macranthoides]
MSVGVLLRPECAVCAAVCAAVHCCSAVCCALCCALLGVVCCVLCTAVCCVLDCFEDGSLEHLELASQELRPWFSHLVTAIANLEIAMVRAISNVECLKHVYAHNALAMDILLCRVCGNPHGLIRKYGIMCCRQCFRSNAKEIGFIKIDVVLLS